MLKKKVQDCGVAHTSCVVKKKNYIEDMSGRPDNDITLNECKQWAESQSTLPWKGEKQTGVTFQQDVLFIFILI